MCELFALSASAPVEIRLSLAELARHGGQMTAPLQGPIAISLSFQRSYAKCAITVQPISFMLTKAAFLSMLTGEHSARAL